MRKEESAHIRQGDQLRHFFQWDRFFLSKLTRDTTWIAQTQGRWYGIPVKTIDKQLTKQALKDAHRVLLSKEALAEGSSYVHPLLSHFGLRRSESAFLSIRKEDCAIAEGQQRKLLRRQRLLEN